MFDSPRELLDKIRLGESTFLEFKEIRFSGKRVTSPSRDSLADELAAFANGRGGVCLLGVEDNSREILGIPINQLPVAENFIQEICSDSVNPPIIPIIDYIWLPSIRGEDVPIIKVDIVQSMFVHRSPGGYLYRIGSSKREMSPEYLARLVQQRGQVWIRPFDEQIVPNARLDDLNPNLCDRFISSIASDSRSNILSKLHIVRLDEDDEWRPTVAGILMASGNSRQWLPNAYIQAVAYRGTDIRTTGTLQDTYQQDAADIEGSLDQQITRACQFVSVNMKTVATKFQGRIDKPQFDMTAVFEAIVNAVAHRDYSVHGSKIRLNIFENRLEIYSPGTIPNAMTIESLPYLQSTRNEVITSLLAKCPAPIEGLELSANRSTMMDKRGEGVPIILGNSERLSGRLPEYRLIDDAELMLTIYAPED